MPNHLPFDAPQRAGRKRSNLPEKYEQRPPSLRVRRSLTMCRPAGSPATVPCSVRGPRPWAKTWPSGIVVIDACGAVVSRSVVLAVWVWAGDEEVVDPDGDVVPHVPSSPSCTQTRSPVERTVPGLVARTSIEPVVATGSAASPPEPVVALAPPAVAVTPAAGLDPPEPSRVTACTLNGAPFCAVAGTVRSSGDGLWQPAPKQSG